MVSTRLSIIFIAVCLQSAWCARLKRSSTQRKVAQENLIRHVTPGVEATGQNEEPTPTPQLVVSEALMNEKEKIEGFIADEEARKHNYELDLKVVEADLEHTRQRLKNDSKVWKIWNWRIWSDHLKKLEADIAWLENRKKSLGDKINETKTAVSNLHDAKAWTHDAAQRAQMHEKRIESLQNQLVDAQKAHVDTVQRYVVAEKQAKEANDEKLRVFEAELAALSNEIAKHQAELDSLNNEEHDLHKAMAETRKNMKETIAQHEANIKSFGAKIQEKDRELREAEKSRDQSKERTEAVLNALRAEREALLQESATETAQMEAAEKALTAKTAEGNAAIEAMKKQLKEQIDGLNADIRARTKAANDQRRDNEAEILAFKAKFNQDVEDRTRQINQFMAAKQESMQQLNALRQEHGEIADDATVSEALHKAKADLDFQLKLQIDAQGAASERLKNIEEELKLKKAEHANANKWYKFWHWKIWSDTLTNLEHSIASLQTEQKTNEEAKSKCADSISRLSAQIESKLTASKLAQVEEVAIVTLDKQIVEQQGEKRKALEDHQTKLALKKETGEDQIETFKAMVQELKNQKSTAEATLGELESGTHEKHVALEKAKATITQTIETHKKAIQNLTAAISVGKSNEDELQIAEKNAAAEHENLVASLTDDTAQLNTHKQSEEAYKKTAESKLSDLEAGHVTEVEELKGDLRSTIADLKQAQADQKSDYEAEKLESEKMRQMERNKHDEDTLQLQGQIDNLVNSKSQAEEVLQDIHEAHLG